MSVGIGGSEYTRSVIFSSGTRTQIETTRDPRRPHTRGVASTPTSPKARPSTRAQVRRTGQLWGHAPPPASRSSSLLPCAAPTHTSYTPLSPVASRSSVALHSVSCYSGPNTSRVRPWLHRPHDSRGHVFAWPGRQCSTAQAVASLPAESTES